MRYELSQRQLKELTERARSLQIAIPLPSWLIEEREIAEHVHRVLPLNRDWVTSIFPTTIDVYPLVQGDGLTGYLGQIRTDNQPDEANLVMEVSVALVDLCATERPRGHLGPQWPGSVTSGGVRRG